MTVLKILVAGHPVLKKIASPVHEISEKIKKLAADMAETMKFAKGLGLAAPQVGESLRLVVLDIGYLDFDALSKDDQEKAPDPVMRPLVLVNPEIISGQGTVEQEEGCLSVPGYRAVVPRYESIHFRYTDLNGKLIERSVDGLFAIAVQHEIDHLNGTLFIERISRLKRNIAQKKVKKYLEELDPEDDETSYRLYG